MKPLSLNIALFCLLLLNPFSAHAATILVFGDILSAGYGLSQGEEWPALLVKKVHKEKMPRINIINASISGETSEGGLARFADQIKQHKPTIVILELGANDGLRGQSISQMKHNLGEMISHSQKQGAKVLLIAMKIPPNYGNRYTKAFEQSYFQLQKQYDVMLSDFLLESLSGKPELIQKDGLHPTAEAQALILETVWKSLKPLLQTKQ